MLPLTHANLLRLISKLRAVLPSFISWGIDDSQEELRNLSPYLYFSCIATQLALCLLSLSAGGVPTCDTPPPACSGRILLHLSSPLGRLHEVWISVNQLLSNSHFCTAICGTKGKKWMTFDCIIVYSSVPNTLGKERDILAGGLALIYKDKPLCSDRRICQGSGLWLAPSCFCKTSSVVEAELM